MTEPFVLTDEIVRAVTAHMNGDHTDDSVVICRGVGARPDTRTATMTGMDRHAISFAITTAAGDDTVTIPFSAVIADRAQIRAEVAQMFHDSVAPIDPSER